MCLPAGLAQPKKSLFIVGKIIIETNEIQNISWSQVGVKKSNVTPEQPWPNCEFSISSRQEFGPIMTTPFLPTELWSGFDKFCPKIQNKYFCGKVLFTHRYTWWNFCLRLLRLVNNCLESIYKTQKSQMKIWLY